MKERQKGQHGWAVKVGETAFLAKLKWNLKG